MEIMCANRCNRVVLTLEGGVADSGIQCPECGRIFCDSCYDTGLGDGCHCHVQQEDTGVSLDAKKYNVVVIPSKTPEHYEPHDRYLLVPVGVERAEVNQLIREARLAVVKEMGADWGETDLWAELEKRGFVAPDYMTVSECWDDDSDDPVQEAGDQIVGPRCPTCGANLTLPSSVVRSYFDKDGGEDVQGYGHFLPDHTFEPDRAACLSGGRYDLADNSDRCDHCDTVVS